jgi:hypothetical protein
LVAAVQKTADFVRRVTEHTALLDTNDQDGIVFEPFLHVLHKEEG